MKPTLPSYIDSSTVELWRSCHRKLYFSSTLALTTTARSIHLVAGGAFAAGLEAARRLAYSGAGDHRPTHDDLLQAAYPAFARTWGDFSIEEDHPKSFSNTFQAVAAYLQHYPPLSDPVQPIIRPDGSPAVEFTFSIPLEPEEGFKVHPETGDPILFVGRFDLLGKMNGLPVVLDEKTTQSLGATWVNQWRLRSQFMAYCWACQRLGYPVHTAVASGIALLKTEYKFERAYEMFPSYIIDRWYTQMRRDVNQIIDAYTALKKGGNIDDLYDFNFSNSCTSYGGCAYQILCLSKNPEDFYNNFVKNTWNPLAKEAA